MSSCRLCHQDALTPVIDLGQMPIAHRLLKTKGEREELFPFAVAACRACGLPQITQPIDPNILYRSYNFNFSSWKPEPHLPDELDTIHNFIQPKSVFEIGCNDGLFSAKLGERGAETLVGIEPNPVSGEIARGRSIHVYSDMASPALCQDAVAKHGKFDLFVSRQVLEHVLDFENFFACAQLVLKDGGYVFIDVPDFAPAQSAGDVSVLWEEHVSYFTEETLTLLLRRHGFTPVSIKKYNFSGGTVAICAERAKAERLPASVSAATRFGDLARAYGDRLVPALKRARDKGQTIAIYGAGCRACTWTNYFDLGGLIDISIDDQQERHGFFTPGARIPIKPMTVLNDQSSPLICLLAVNNENDEKVSAKLRSSLTRPHSIVPIFAPGDLWGGLKQLESV